VDETNGDIGGLTFYVDTTRLPTLIAGKNYVLIIDDDQDGDFTTGTLTYLNLEDRFGTWATANNVDFADGDVFTIGSAINVGSTTGNWYDPNTWLLGNVPSTVDNIEIASPVIVTLDGEVTIEDLTVRAGAGLDLNGFRLTITNSLTVETATDFIAGTGTVEYASTSGNVYVESLTYHNLDVSGSGTKTLRGDIVISNDLTINNNPTLDVDGTSNFTITVLGDWINAVNSTFNPQQGQVIFQGTSLQQITKTGTPEQFYDLQLDNVLDLQLGSSINISNRLVFNVDNGFIFTQTHRLDVENSNVNAILNSGPLRYVVTDGGQLQREVAAGSTYTFPVGDATNYTPFVFDFTSGTVTDLDVSVTPSAHPNIETAGDYISRFWSVEPVAGTANYDLLINYVQTDFNGISEASIKPVKYNTNQIGDGDFVLDVVATTIAWSGLISFSDVNAGNEVALPVDLLEFTGTYNNGVVSLLWKTASETNNSHFEVYKLLPGEELRFIGEEQGAGNSGEQLDYRFYDRSPALGINYYQLRQYDFDGQYEVFEMIAVDVSLLDSPLQLAVYPNPSLGNAITLVLSGLQSGVLFDISIVSLQGKEVFRRSLQMSIETFDLNFDQQLSSGIYVIEINYQDQSVIQKLLIR
jgi:hypothetical protein